MSLYEFNTTTNSILDTFYGNPFISAALRLFIVLYGSLAAPQIPVKWGPFLSHSVTRVVIMALIIWVGNHDAILSLLLALSWMLTMNYLTKNAVSEVAETGQVTPDVAVIISGGNGPSISNSVTMKNEAVLMQASVDNIKSSGPQAVDAAAPPSTAANAGIASIPSGTPASNPTMMAEKPAGLVPQAFAPDGIHDLAAAS